MSAWAGCLGVVCAMEATVGHAALLAGVLSFVPGGSLFGSGSRRRASDPHAT